MESRLRKKRAEAAEVTSRQASPLGRVVVKLQTRVPQDAGVRETFFVNVALRRALRAADRSTLASANGSSNYRSFVSSAVYKDQIRSGPGWRPSRFPLDLPRLQDNSYSLSALLRR